MTEMMAVLLYNDWFRIRTTTYIYLDSLVCTVLSIQIRVIILCKRSVNFKKGFLRSSISSKKRTKILCILVKMNPSIHFLEGIDDTINHFETNLPLLGISQNMNKRVGSNKRGGRIFFSNFNKRVDSNKSR